MRKSVWLLAVLALLSFNGCFIFLGGLDGDVEADQYEPNNDYFSATTLSLNSPLDASIDTDADEDWYVFTAGVADENRAFQAVLEATPGQTEEVDTFVTFYQSDGTTTVDFDDDGGDGWYSELVSSGMDQATYFVAVTSMNYDPTGYYRITLNKYDGPENSIDAYDDVSITNFGAIQDANDADWYVLYTTSGLSYSVDLELSGISTLDGVLEIYAGTDTATPINTGTSDEGWGGDDEIESFNATTTTYYLVIKSADSSTGNYRLIVH